MKRLRVPHDALQTLDEGHELVGEFGGFQTRDGIPIATILGN